MTPAPSPSTSGISWWNLTAPSLNEVVGWIVAPLVVGIVLFVLAEYVGRRRAKRDRRRRIVTLMARADSLIERAIIAGDYNDGKRGQELSIWAEYQDTTVETLALFEWGEQDVSLWAAMELAAAVDAPAHAIERAKGYVPRRFWDELKVGESDMVNDVSGAPGLPMIVYLKVRYIMLRHWADLKGEGPQYANADGKDSKGRPADGARHYVFPPGTDSIAGIELPYVWLMKDYEKLSEREMLESQYADPYGGLKCE